MTEQPKGVLPPPYALTVLLCDEVYRDAATGKAFILGAFTEVRAKQFPAAHSKMVLYIELTGGRGSVELNLRLVDVNEEREPLFNETGKLPFVDPRSIMAISFELQNVVFPGPGEYRFQVYCNNEPIMERRLLVRGVEK
jgi:hypothetical protein